MDPRHDDTEPAASDPGAGGFGAFGGDTVRVRLDISYDGTDFAGWAVQPGRRTVAGDVRSALETILRTPVHLTAAGRTDAGVHAVGQVAHLDLPRPVWAEHSDALVRSLAGVLRRDVRVRAARLVPADFHARYSGLARTYVYRITDTDWGADPLRRRDTVHWSRRLDEKSMRVASTPLLGLRDFTAFCTRPERGTAVRTLLALDWQRRDDHVLEATVRADAFCRSMVRGLVGALIKVGEHGRPPSWPASLLGAERRSDRVRVAPALGLTLVRIDYPPDDELAARNAVTRATRSPGTVEAD